VAERPTSDERFTAVVRTVALPVRQYVVRRLPADQVDDVLAEVFLVLWRRLDDVPAEDPLPWAYGVARNCVANARRSTRRNLALVAKVTRLDPPRPDEPVNPHDDVHQALAQLSDLDRELVSLWAWEGLTPREIAATLGMTANAVSIRLTRAKQKLGEILRKNDEAAGQERDEGRRP